MNPRTRVRTAVGRTMLGLALMLLASEAVALADPLAGLRMDDAAYVFVVTSPWYVHAGRFGAIALMVWFSMRVLNRGARNRPVRERGFTPAEQ